MSRAEILQTWMVAVLFFALSNLSYVKIISPFSGTELREIFNIRTIVDAAGVFLLYLLYTQKVEADRRKEIDAIRNVLHTQYMQFRQSQENMDLINRKYHDLKHQLHILRAQDDNRKRQEYIDEIEKEIRIYDMDYKTGNSVLDTILTTKGGQCLRYGIRLNVVADGGLLDHIHVIDLATIFGNALDNAIEHEIQIPDEHERMIHVSVSRKNRMVSIVIENYFRGSLREEGGILQTTKPDTQNHGYGIKSMRHAVKKYGGVLTAGVEDGWFRLKILLPGIGSEET